MQCKAQYLANGLGFARCDALIVLNDFLSDDDKSAVAKLVAEIDAMDVQQA
jgi:hypothetical protein